MIIRSPRSSSKVPLSAVHPADFLAGIRKGDVRETIAQLWAMPYPADPILEPECDGLTYGQVAVLRQMTAAANGVGEALDRILDRLIGRPVMVNKNLNVQASYKDYLDEIARKEGLLNEGPSDVTSTIE